MPLQTFNIPRPSIDELTYATMTVDLTDDAIRAGYLNVPQLKECIIDACTDWVKQTAEGKKAWEDSSHTFSIGELAHEDLGPINQRLKEQGIQIVSLVVDSMEASEDR
jgi:hypothetical protein